MSLRKYKLIALLVCAAVSGAGYAGYSDFSAKPDKCPDAAIVQRNSMSESNMVEDVHGRETCCDANGFPYHIDGEWSVNYIDYFDTAYRWSLHTSTLFVDNAHEALVEVRRKLTGLIFAGGPYVEMGNLYCEYQSVEGGVSLSYR